VFCVQHNDSSHTSVRYTNTALVPDLSPRGHGFDPTSVHVRYMVDEVSLGQVLYSTISVLPCKHRSANAPYTSSSSYNSYQKDERAKPGNLHTRQCSYTRGALDRRVLSRYLYQLYSSEGTGFS